jgi:[ribosomal protein S18]-alanine N-acetyltransferase
MNLTLRYMHLSDITEVVTIDRESFSTPWTERSYIYEIKDSTYSHMLTLATGSERPVNGWRKLLRSLSGKDAGYEVQDRVLGYGGLWNVMDEAHISTVATAPEQRGKGYGELLLAAMIKKSILLEATYIVLEVRVSNITAKKLYRKYEFEVANVKKNYYRDDKEDAYDMRLDLTDRALLDRFNTRYEALLARFSLTDFYNVPDNDNPLTHKPNSNS